MANPEHVAKLREAGGGSISGVRDWNVWRKLNPDIDLDLEGVNLKGADLRGINLGLIPLKKVHLSRDVDHLGRVDLRRANLGETNLEEVDLNSANLEGANLGWANLEGANLKEAFLNKTYLVRAKLYEANLSKASLVEADLSGAFLNLANLTNADLRGAHLDTAHLIDTNLRRANLSEADLSEAWLQMANLVETHLVGANLTRAELWETIFVNVDLTDAKGLESCIHKGPSIIDYHTPACSGNLPLTFLQGCGLDDWEIEVTKLYQPGLSHQQISDIVYRIHAIRAERPIQHYSCFISYSSKDEALAKRLHADLQDKGVRCWFAPEDMKIGDKFRVRIDEAIRTYEKLLLLLSEHSVASAWVEKEVETAFDREIERNEPVLFPIRLDAAVLESKTGWAADIRRSRYIGDFCKWKDRDKYQKGLERLLRDLQIEKNKIILFQGHIGELPQHF